VNLQSSGQERPGPGPSISWRGSRHERSQLNSTEIIGCAASYVRRKPPQVRADRHPWCRVGASFETLYCQQCLGRVSTAASITTTVASSNCFPPAIRRRVGPNRPVTVFHEKLLHGWITRHARALRMTGVAMAQENGPQSNGPNQEVDRLTKELEFTPNQRKQARPLLEEHHDRIHALFDKNLKLSREDLGLQIHAISDGTRHEVGTPNLHFASTCTRRSDPNSSVLSWLGPKLLLPPATRSFAYY
jgi:hypothetical protein